MSPLELVRLPGLMERSHGRPEIRVALIDGPVAMDHPDLVNSSIRQLPGKLSGTCSLAHSVACKHGTFVAGVLAARRGSKAPAICPGCTLLVRPIFSEIASANGDMPSATADELAAAIVDAVNAGARVVNMSAALLQPSSSGELKLEAALNYAAGSGVIAVAAAGNQGTVGSSAITRHPWVIPVAACDSQGRPMGESNFGHSIGTRGLLAPGYDITSLGTDGKPNSFGGTSAAAPFVTGTVALLWSEFTGASAAQLKLALCGGHSKRRAAIVPPLMDAWAAYRAMAN